MATATETKASEDLVCPSCGRRYPPNTNGPHFFALHVATCKGPVATSGRIAARSGSSFSTTIEAKKQEHRRADPPRRKRPSMPRRRKNVERTRRGGHVGGRSRKGVMQKPAKKRATIRHPARSTEGPAAAISPADFIAACRAEIAKLENAIAAVEALG